MKNIIECIRKKLILTCKKNLSISRLFAKSVCFNLFNIILIYFKLMFSDYIFLIIILNCLKYFSRKQGTFNEWDFLSPNFTKRKVQYVKV